MLGLGGQRRTTDRCISLATPDCALVEPMPTLAASAPIEPPESHATAGYRPVRAIAQDHRAAPRRRRWLHAQPAQHPPTLNTSH